MTAYTYDSSTGEIIFHRPVLTRDAAVLDRYIRGSVSYGGPWRRERRRIRTLVAEVDVAETNKARRAAMRTLYEYYATIPEFLSRFKAALAFAVKQLNVWDSIGMGYAEYRRFAGFLEAIKEHAD